MSDSKGPAVLLNIVRIYGTRVFCLAPRPGNGSCRFKSGEHLRTVQRSSLTLPLSQTYKGKVGRPPVAHRTVPPPSLREMVGVRAIQRRAAGIVARFYGLLKFCDSLRICRATIVRPFGTNGKNLILTPLGLGGFLWTHQRKI